MSAVVITNPTLDGARACVDVTALASYKNRGWTLVGPAAGPGSIETTDERSERLAAEAAAERAALAPRTPDQQSKPSPRRGR